MKTIVWPAPLYWLKFAAARSWSISCGMAPQGVVAKRVRPSNASIAYCNLLIYRCLCMLLSRKHPPVEPLDYRALELASIAKRPIEASVGRHFELPDAAR